MRFERCAAWVLTVVLTTALPCARAADTDVAARYVGEAWQTGGAPERGSAWLDLIEASITMRGLRIIGFEGTGKLAAQRNTGRAITQSIGASAPLSSIEAPSAVRVSEAWLELTTADLISGSVKFGVMDLNDDFDTSALGGLFANSTFGLEIDFAQSGLAGPATYPTQALGARGRVQRGCCRLQAAVFDGVPGTLQDSSRPSLRLSSGEGALAVVEVGGESANSRWYVGAWRYSTNLPPLRATLDASTRSERGSAGFYALAERNLWSADDGRELRTAVRIGHADQKFNSIRDTVQLALRFDRPWHHEGESFGVAWSSQRQGGPARSVSEARGVSLVDHESVFEITYRRAIGSRLVLRPDLQYFVHPGAVRSRSGAWAAGLGIEIDLSP